MFRDTLDELLRDHEEQDDASVSSNPSTASEATQHDQINEVIEIDQNAASAASNPSIKTIYNNTTEDLRWRQDPRPH